MDNNEQTKTIDTPDRIDPVRPAFGEYPSSQPDTTITGPKRHSGPGLASFIIAILSLISFITLLITTTVIISDSLGAGMMNGLTPEKVQELLSQQSFIFISLGMIGTIAAAFVGTVLGIIGLLQRNRRKIFAVIGTIMNGLATGLVVLIVLASLAV